MRIDALAEIRRLEQRKACDRLGVKGLSFLGYEDGVLVNTLARLVEARPGLHTMRTLGLPRIAL